MAVTNVGILVGFLLLAYQLSLSTEAIRLQAAVGAVQQQTAGELAFMGETTHEAFSIAMLDPGALTDAQVGQMWAYLGVGMNANQNLRRGYEAGFVSAEELENSMERTIPGYLGSDFGRLYWNAVKQAYPLEFADRVDAVVAKNTHVLEEQYRTLLDVSAEPAQPGSRTLVVHESTTPILLPAHSADLLYDERGSRVTAIKR